MSIRKSSTHQGRVKAALNTNAKKRRTANNALDVAIANHFALGQDPEEEYFAMEGETFDDDQKSVNSEEEYNYKPVIEDPMGGITDKNDISDDESSLESYFESDEESDEDENNEPAEKKSVADVLHEVNDKLKAFVESE